MFDRWGYSVLRDEAGEGEGGGVATITETPEQIELRELKESNAAKDKRIDELSASERAWSDRALRATREPAPRELKEVATPEEIETGEQLLDDLSKDGLKALQKRGFVKLADVQKLIDETVERTTGEGRAEGQFQSIMADEFPEMAADLALFEAGKAPKTELFVMAAEIYRDAIALDPELKGSKSALIMAARQAAATLEAQGKRKADDRTERQANRRQRIEAQRPDRSQTADDDGAPELNAKQKQMAKDLGISEDKFLKQQQRIRGERGK